VVSVALAARGRAGATGGSEPAGPR
jgi:hypothetical protein